MEARSRSYAQMEAAIPPNTAGYSYSLRCAAALYQAFFMDVTRTSKGWVALGKKINRLTRALEMLCTEVGSGEGRLVRNGHGAAEALGIALNGVQESLKRVESALVGIRRYSGRIDGRVCGERKLRELEKLVGYHCWAFDLVMRTIMK